MQRRAFRGRFRVIGAVLLLVCLCSASCHRGGGDAPSSTTGGPGVLTWGTGFWDVSYWQ